ncbi:MAG: methylmalonyl-CoA epimerase [Deltaproteobacteria bacterium]|nr:methylmalonyl-CoA epimerase [Deltaproteobacteria bacterium]
MIEKIDHLGIAVKNVEKTLTLYGNVLGLEVGDRFEHGGMRGAFIRVGEVEIELLESGDPDNPIARHIEKRGEGFHHIAFKVTDVKEEMKSLREKGIELVDAEPRPGAHGSMIAFLHPKATGGVLMELVQKQE